LGIVHREYLLFTILILAEEQASGSEPGVFQPEIAGMALIMQTHWIGRHDK
jgi:hypothetical protein